MSNQEPVRFDSVSFTYPPVEAGEEANRVFEELTVDIGPGVTTLVGPNGVGKSTLMLLAGGRVMPDSGTVYLLGEDTRRFAADTPTPELEARRNAAASFVYQNMEFETEEPVGELLEYVMDSGNVEGGREFLAGIQEALELEPSLRRRTQELSKGELQRTIIAFSLLYGSPVILMDEPVFALEEPQKDRVFSFLMEHARDRELTILYSAHNIDLSAKYSDRTLLFHKEGKVTIGPTPEIFTRENLEAAFQAPYDTLYQRQNLYRDVLNRLSRPEEPGTEEA